MTDTTDPVAAYLAEAKARFSNTSYAIITDSPRLISILAASTSDIPRLLAALDAALALHQPEPGQHPDFCGADLREMPCPTVRAISAELLGGQQ